MGVFQSGLLGRPLGISRVSLRLPQEWDGGQKEGLWAPNPFGSALHFRTLREILFQQRV